MSRLGLVILSASLCSMDATNLRAKTIPLGIKDVHRPSDQDIPPALPSVGAVIADYASDGGPVHASGLQSVVPTKKYLISTFPSLKTVAYTHLPDTVWRPLYVGTVSNPMSVVADQTNARLFVGDPALGKIFWYRLIIGDDGFLKTDGIQHVAVDGVTPYWMSVDGVGDLYFTGQVSVLPPATGSRNVYRMDSAKIESGDARNPVKVYGRDDTGFPVPKVWMPSGIAVDSFDIYWGNQEHGSLNGAVCSGGRKNIGSAGAYELNVLSQASNEVRGVAIAGTNLFYVTPNAIYGMDKNVGGDPVRDPYAGMIQSSATPDGWDPVSIAYDGEGTLYWTEARSGIIYQIPSADTNPHPMHKFVDAPLVYGVTVFSQAGASKGSPGLNKNFGVMVTSAQAAENAAPATFHTTLWACLLAIALHFQAS